MMCFAQVKEIDFRLARNKLQMLFDCGAMQEMHKVNIGTKYCFQTHLDSTNGSIIENTIKKILALIFESASGHQIMQHNPKFFSALVGMAVMSC